MQLVFQWRVLKEKNIYSLVRLTLPGYNSFSRSLSVITPGVEFVGTEATLLELEGGIGTDNLGGLDTIIGFGSRGEVCSADNASS